MNIAKVLTLKYPGRLWTLRGNDYERLEIHDDLGKPPYDELLQKNEEIILEEKANQYRLDRADAYPPIGDQLDMMYHDKMDGTNTWVDCITAVKKKYPKPT